MKSEEQYKNIIIVTNLRIGDFVWATSALSLIKNYDKNIKITLVVHKAYVPLISKSLNIDNIITINNKLFMCDNKIVRYIYKIYWCFISFFKFKANNTVIFLVQFKAMTIASKYLYRIKNIIGPDTFVFGHNIKNPDTKHYSQIIKMPPDSDRTHMSVRYQTIIRSVFPTYNLALPVIADTSYLADEAKKLIGMTKKYKIALCTRGVDKQKIWDIENVKSVIGQLNNITNVTFFIIGTGAEAQKEAVKLISDLPDISIKNITGKTSLLLLKEFFKNIDLLISVDTGVVHIASVVNTPLIALYGQGLPEQFRPLNPKAISLCSYRNCSPCNINVSQGKTCQNNLLCLKDISADIIVDSAKKLLNI
jgi:ADP-heptose:LPS heptosyltransferase